MNKLQVLVIGSSLILVLSCKPKPPRNRLDENHFPRVILWAWERPEDLKSIDAKRFAVAFLAQTLVLKGSDVVVEPRHQPLELPPEIKLIAVTRIESRTTNGQIAALSDAQRDKAVTLLLRTLQLRNVTGLQIDYDATVSERDFYRALLYELRAKLPDNISLSMTALASFCVGDRWLDDLPVDEAVPMIFRMGADDRTIKNLLASGEDFHEPLCQRSYGIAVDEPLDAQLRPDRRVYIFNQRSWAATDIESVSARIDR
jgi:uncharacterized protein DUF3142